MPRVFIPPPLRSLADGAQVIEVNGIPAWKGVQAACRVDIAQCLVDDFCERYLLRNSVKAVGV